MSYRVCYGIYGACVISGGFACTREELPVELARVSRPAIGRLLRYESYSSLKAAREVAKHCGNGGAEPEVLNAAQHR